MESLQIVNLLNDFVQKEKEKRPKYITIYHIKEESDNQISLVKFLAIVDYYTNVRVYKFNQNGFTLSGKNYDNSKVLEIIKKLTQLAPNTECLTFPDLKLSIHY